MIYKTRAIVLTHTKYAESSIISHVFTEEFGRQSYIINQVRSKQNKGKVIFLQPLSLLELEVYHSPKRSIQRIKDFRTINPFSLIPFDQIRRGIVFFLAEFLNKILKEEEQNHSLFEYLYNSILLLDSKLDGIQNFHLFIVFHLTKSLGFFPNYSSLDNDKYFNMNSGTFVENEPDTQFYMNVWQSSILKQLNNINISEIKEIKLNGAERTEMLEKLLEYYRLHLEGFGQIRSLQVLKELFH